MSYFIGIFGQKADCLNLSNVIDLKRYQDNNKSVTLSNLKKFHYQVIGAFEGVSHTSSTSANPQDEKYVLIDGHIYTSPHNNSSFIKSFDNDEALQSTLLNLTGQYAIAYLSHNRLLLCRDHLGIKSLYYSCLPNGCILFSSEIKELLFVLRDSLTLNQNVIECFRGIGYNLFHEETVFQNIRSVKPGGYIEFRVDGKSLSYSYYSSQQTSCEIDKELDIPLVEKKLNEGLIQCVDNDVQVPKALFFSGGLDSSYLFAFLAQKAKSRIVPFTMWDSSNHSDIEDARVLASEFHIDLSEHKVDWNELNQMIINYAWHFANPLGTNGFDLLGGVAFHILAWIIAQKGFQVALCGEGADEMFIGYHQYHMEPSMLVSALENAIKTYGLRGFKDRLKELGVFSQPEESLRKIAFEYGLSEYHLRSVECSGNAFNLDIRPPYLNYKLADILLTYPSCKFIDKKDYWTKIPLRKIFKQTIIQTSARTAIRRKRAMSYALYCFNERLNEEISKRGLKLSLAEAFWRLFFYLHIDNSFSSAPSFSFTDILPELERMGER